MEKIKITGKNVLVGVSKSLFWASMGFVATTAVNAVIYQKSFVGLAKDSLTNNKVGYIAAAPFILVSAWGYTHYDAVDFNDDWDNN